LLADDAGERMEASSCAAGEDDRFVIGFHGGED